LSRRAKNVPRENSGKNNLDTFREYGNIAHKAQTVDKAHNHKSQTSASLIAESRRDGILDR